LPISRGISTARRPEKFLRNDGSIYTQIVKKRRRSRAWHGDDESRLATTGTEDLHIEIIPQRPTRLRATKANAGIRTIAPTATTPTDLCAVAVDFRSDADSQGDGGLPVSSADEEIIYGQVGKPG
jgi:hypothetical protein